MSRAKGHNRKCCLADLLLLRPFYGIGCKQLHDTALFSFYACSASVFCDSRAAPCSSFSGEDSWPPAFSNVLYPTTSKVGNSSSKSAYFFPPSDFIVCRSSLPGLIQRSSALVSKEQNSFEDKFKKKIWINGWLNVDIVQDVRTAVTQHLLMPAVSLAKLHIFILSDCLFSSTL